MQHQVITPEISFSQKLKASLALTAERQANLDATLARIEAIAPNHIGPAEIFARLIAAGQPVAIVTERGA